MKNAWGWAALIALGAVLGANANHFKPQDLLGAALDKKTFTVEDKGDHYSITRGNQNG